MPMLMYTVNFDLSLHQHPYFLFLARPNTFMEIDHELFHMVILLFPLIQEGLLSVTNESMCTEYWLLSLSLSRKKVWLDFKTDRL